MTTRPSESRLAGPNPLRLRHIFEEHAAFVCRSLRRLGVLEADLDDVLQEVFMVVYQRLTEYQERGRARSWLYSICTRLAAAHRRKAGRRRESTTPELPDTPAEATQHTRLEEREALALGQRLLALLPEEEREVFVLYEVEGMAMTEIAEARGCPLQTAYSRLYQARRRIGEHLQRNQNTGAGS